jgi:hypothetical protein
MACVADSFCDKFGEVSTVSLLLSKAEKDQRGKLIVSRGGKRVRRVLEFLNNL